MIIQRSTSHYGGYWVKCTLYEFYRRFPDCENCLVRPMCIKEALPTMRTIIKPCKKFESWVLPSYFKFLAKKEEPI